MVYLKDLLFSITFPIRYWIERYKDYQEERKYKQKIKELKKKDPYIYK